MTEKKQHNPHTEKEVITEGNITWYLGETPEVLTDVQQAAIDLHQRGFNVFPLPTAKEWLLRPEEDGKIKKAPYSALQLGKVYASRLHLDLNFVLLFERANIGVVCGRTSGNLVAIDCDSDKAFQYIGTELIKHGIASWINKSSRGGHYLLRIQEGEAVNMSRGKLMGLPKRISKDVEVLGNRLYVVLPPSIHPLSGVAYQWQSPGVPSFVPPKEDIPVVSIRDLEWLGLRRASKGKQEDRPEGMENISNANYEFWQKGTVEGYRNKKLTALIYDLAGNNVEQEKTFELALTAANRCDPPYPKSHLQQMVNAAYDSPRTPARSYYDDNPSLRSYQRDDSPQNEERNVLSEFAQTFNWGSYKWIYKWQLQTGLCKGYYQVRILRADSVKKVFVALVERFRMEGRTVFRASEREVSEIASVSEKTVRAVIHVLLDAGLIQSKGRSRVDARLISFGDISKRTALFTPLSSSAVVLEKNIPLPVTDAEKDVFGSRSAYLIWRHLRKSPEKNAHQTAKKMNLPSSTVSAAFKWLKKMGLISQNEEGKYAGLSKTDAELQKLSMEIGTHGKAQRKVERHQQERQTYLNAHFKTIKARYHAKTTQLMVAQEISETPTLPVVTSLLSSPDTISERAEQTPDIDLASETSTVSYKDVKVFVDSSKDNEKNELASKKRGKKELVNLEQEAVRAIRQLSEKLEENRREQRLQLQATYEKMRNTPYSPNQNFPPAYDQFRHLRTHEERRAALQQADKEWYAAHLGWWHAPKKQAKASSGISTLAYGN
jgi:DNA-binding transcriptional ArsR family regulator